MGKKVFFVTFIMFFLNAGFFMAEEKPEITKKMLGAVRNNKIDQAKQYLEMGADVNGMDKKDNTAIIFATENDNLEMIRMLINYKADLGVSNKKGDMPLLLVKSPEAVNLLVDGGARIDKFNKKRNNPLLNAAVKKDIRILEALLKKGAKTELRNSRGQTPLLLAVLDHRVEEAKVLIKHSFIDNQDKSGNTALLYAADEDIILALLESGADFKIKNNVGVIIGNESLMLCIELGFEKAVNKYIELGQPINFVDSYGDTPLIYAVKKNKVKIAEILLKSGADVSIKDASGNTPVQIAVSQAMKDMVNLLIKYGAEI